MMFAVMKHWDIMLGVDQHICWPPGAPEPIGAKPYFVCMLMMGTMITAQMAFTAVTISGWTMQRGTDIGPLIPHIGIPSILTPLDMLFSSSASYFGPSSYMVEGAPAAAALIFVVNLNLNCNHPCPLPTGFVLCFTTHYCGMTLFDILFGFIAMGVAIAIEVVVDKLAGAAAGAVKKQIIAPISRRITAKAASRRAAKAAIAKPSAGAGAAAARSAPSPGAAGSAPSAGSAGSAGSPWQAARPSKSAGQQAPAGQWQSASPSQAGGGPQAGAHRPRPDGPQIGGHRPVKPKRISKKKFAADMGLDLGAELVLGVPFDFVNTATLELLALSGIEEFGASGDQEEA